MKKTLQVALILPGVANALYAQPTLTAATTNPVAGDIFCHHQCNQAGITKGSSGAGVTWDFSSLTQIAADTLSYMNCG